MKATTMHDEVQDKLDSMLRSHLARELDPHVGSATRKISGSLHFTAGGPAESSHWFSRIRFASAAALMLSIGVVGSIVYRNMNKTTSELPGVPQTVPFTQAVQSSWTQTYDQGTVMIDAQTPARMLRRVQYEKTDWKVQSGKWQSRIDIPKQDVILVDMQKQ